MNHDKTRPLQLGVMAKYWQPGKVKTRLGQTVGMTRSAELHRAFCRHLANQLAATGQQRSFVISPPDRRSEFEDLVGTSWGIEEQADGDLGNRIRTWFGGGTPARPTSSIDRILIGADCPLIGPSTILRAHRCLIDHDVVLGPARDGGYYLIGLRDSWQPRYQSLTDDIPWSSEAVLEITKQRAADVGLRIAMLSEMEDIDTIDELRRLDSQLSESRSGNSRLTEPVIASDAQTQTTEADFSGDRSLGELCCAVSMALAAEPAE